MRTVSKIVIAMCIIYIMQNCYAQIFKGSLANQIHAQNIIESKSREEFFSIENEEFNILLKKIFPDVVLKRFRSVDIVPNGISNNLYLNESIYNLHDFNYLLFRIKYTADSTSTYTDEELIKLYMYLEILFTQRCYDTCRINFPVNFEISKIEKSYEGKIAEYLSKEGFVNKKLNYTVIATWKAVGSDEQAEVREYDFNIENSELISIVERRVITQDLPTFYMSSENQAFQSIRFFPYSDEMEKYIPTGKEKSRKLFENDKKKVLLNSTNEWGKVNAVSISGPITSYIKRNNDNYIHILTAINNNGSLIQTNPSCKFRITGYQDLINPILKIFTISTFGPKVELFSSSLEENINEQTAETTDFFTPINSAVDGFCSFEIYDGNELIHVFEHSYAVLYKRKQAYISSGALFSIDYAERFFYNHPSGYNGCEQYLVKLGFLFDQVWVEQINLWSLNGGNPPSNVGHYELSVNPFQDNVKFFFFLYNDLSEKGNIIDFYQTYTPQRHIGITANPSAFINQYNYEYSEDEFLKSALHHEFYHGLQYTYNQDIALNPLGFWLLEGQARAIQSVGVYNAEFLSRNCGMYNRDANTYILNNLNKSLLKLSYDYSLFWRFLFENSTTSGNIADKLAIFRQTCEGFNATNITDIEKHMNQKLQSTPFKTMDNAVVEYAKRVLFNDPEYNTWNPCPSVDFYARVPYLTINYNGTETSRKNNINSSYGIDYYLISFQATGKTLINFNGDPNNDGIAPHYNVNLYFLDSPDSPVNINIVKGVGSKEIELLTPNRMAFLAITRIDDKEDSKLTEDYGLIIGPRVPANRINASFSAGGNKSGSGYYPTGALIDFYDQSYGGNHPLTQWNWTFTGGYPSNSSLQNPEQIYYLSPGSYPVSLTVSNSAGEFDSKTINGYINVYNPGNGTTYEELDLTTHCQSYAQANQQASLSLWINSGTPPYQISISTDNQQTVIYSGQSSETFHHIFNSWSNSGTKGIWYLVTDALGNTGESYESISIGLPGSHTVNFSYIWNTSYPNNLGTNTEVFFTDLTDGGYKPYYLWIWEYGAGINTGSIPLNTDGKNWEMRYNAWDDADFDGSPLHPVVFTEYDSYPVTLTVYDNAGFQLTKTVLIDVSTATKCMKLDPTQMSRYNSLLGKNIIKYVHGESVRVFYTVQHLNYFPWWHSTSSYCANKFPFNGSLPWIYASIDNSITDTKISFVNNNINYKRESMPELYVNNPNPGEYNSNPKPLNYCNWTNTTEYNYFEKWAIQYWDWFNYSNCPVNTTFLKWPSTIEFIPPSTGKFILRYEAWNRFSQPNQSAFIPAQEPNLEMYDYIDVPLYVVDCDATEYINTTINPGVYNDDLAGIFEFSNISASTIESGAEITYQSCNQIIMHPGFSALSGSSFLAQVTTLANDDDALLREMLVNSTMDFEPNDFYSCYPNPNGGIFRITHPGTLKSNNIDIFNLSGQPVNFTALDMDFETMIQISNPVTGVYFVRLLLDSGEVLYKKVIVSRL